MVRKFDPISVIEAAYSPAATDGAWLGGILEALSPLEDGRGIYAMALDASDPQDIRATPVAAYRPDAEWSRIGAQAHLESSPEQRRALYWRSPPVALASRRLRQLGRGVAAQHEPVFQAISDVLGLFGVDTDDRGLFIGIPLMRAAPPGPRTVHLLSRVMAHVRSARRLRAWTERADVATTDSDAVLDPAGKVHHATSATAGAGTRRLLAEAVRRIERARSGARGVEPSEAVELWRALVGGRWSLVDHVESDGRRFVLARQNEPGGANPASLSGTERHVAGMALQGHANKYIAYSLGISASTVSAHLAATCRKLGVTSRQELIRAFAVPEPR